MKKHAKLLSARRSQHPACICKVWNAVAPEDDAPRTLGTITCSRLSPSIARLGGGDYDGDTVNVITDPYLIALVYISVALLRLEPPPHCAPWLLNLNFVLSACQHIQFNPVLPEANMFEGAPTCTYASRRSS